MEAIKSGFKKRKSEIGILLGIAIALIVYFIPIPEASLSRGGHITLALTLMTVVFWAFQVMQPAFTSGIFAALLIIFGVIPAVPATETAAGISAQVATASVVFKSWTGSTMWLIVGAYLIATAVKTSGLGERIAYNYLLRFVRSYKSIIIGIFVLTLVLSLLIPHPWPRALLIMSVMAVIIQSSNVPKSDAIKIGFTVFAASVPVSLVFLTGDAVINPLAANYAPQGVNFVQWLTYMGPPAAVASILTVILILVLFKPTQEITINKDEVRQKIASIGKMTGVEIRAAVWLVIAIVLWMTDSVHGIDIGWVTLIVAMGMALPVVGILKPKDWAAVPVQVLVFLTAAIAIGTVGGATGMNAYLAGALQGLFSEPVLGNMFLFALVTTVVAVILHMLLGSVIAVMGVAIPTILAITSAQGMDPLVPTFIVYMAIASHYVFPFQHLNILVGASEETGGYSQKETIKLGLPLVIVVFVVTVGIMIPWFAVTGLL